ncbi:MAG: PcfJ domain-containing protein [Gemmataceae bacterium]|nr:PcfJ domain-containing protein [Gemmataceae bacterium]
MSKYQIMQFANGFAISARPHPDDVPGADPEYVDFCYENTGGRREPVKVVLQPTCFEVIGARSGGVLTKRYRLCETRSILKDISSILMQAWLPNLQHANLHAPVDLPAPYDGGRFHKWHSSKTTRAWAESRCRWAIATRVNACLQQLLAAARVNPDVMAVHRASFAAGYPYVPNALIYDKTLYRNKYVVRDLVNFRAAAALLVRRDDFLHSAEQLVDWRALYCPPGMRPSGHLNKTLSLAPGNVSARLLNTLPEFILPRAITNRLELITTLLVGHHGLPNFHVFSRASAGQITEAVRRVDLSLEQNWKQRMPDSIPYSHLSTRRTANIWKALRFLGDYPDDYHGDIVGLAARSIRWHHCSQERERRLALASHGAYKLVATPPIAPPAIPGVQFLATVGEICQESKNMHHCIASYSQRALNGWCFLFHIEHNGQSASVEVSPGGAVVQAVGPCNVENEASAWGRQLLGQWGSKFHLGIS